MASLAECFKRLNIPQEDRKYLAERVKLLKEGGEDAPTIKAISDAIELEERRRNLLQYQIEEAGGFMPPFEPVLSAKEEEVDVQKKKRTRPPSRTKAMPKESVKEQEEYYDPNIPEGIQELDTTPLQEVIREGEINKNETLVERARRRKAELEAAQEIKDNAEEISSNIFFADPEKQLEALDEKSPEAKRRLLEKQTREEEEKRKLLESAKKGKVYDGWQHVKIDQDGKEVSTYMKDDAVLMKTTKKKNNKIQWLLTSRDKDGTITRWGYFNSKGDAIEAYTKGQDSEEFYKTQEEESQAEKDKLAKEKLDTLSNEEELADLRNKIVGTVIKDAKKIGYEIPQEIDDIVNQAILDAADTFNPEKGTAFVTWATSKAKAAARQAARNPEMQFAEGTSNEGSDADGQLAQTTYEDIGPPTKSEKKEVSEEEKPGEVKTVELSEEEKKAILKRVNEKREKEASKEEKKKETSEVEEKPKKAEEKKETKKRKKVERKAKSTPVKEEVTEVVTEEVEIPPVTEMSDVGEMTPQELLENARADMEILQSLPEDATNEQVAQALGYYDMDMSRDEAIATYTTQIDQLARNLEGKKTIRRRKTTQGEVDESPSFRKAKIVKVIDTAQKNPTEGKWSREELNKNWRPATLNEMTTSGLPVVQITRNGKHIRYLAPRDRRTVSEALPSMAEVWIDLAEGNPYRALSMFERSVIDGSGMTEVEEMQTRKVLENNIKDITKMRERFENRFPNALELVKESAKSGNEVTKMLSNMLLNNVTIRNKLSKVEISKLANYKNPSTYSKDINLISIGLPNPDTYLHEAVHSITVREMETNEELATEVRGMLNKAREAALKNPNISLDQGQIDVLTEIGNSSRFKEEFMDMVEDLDSQRIAYGLLNPREFLAQAFSSPTFQTFLKSIVVEKPARLKQEGVWNMFKDLLHRVAKALGLSNKQFTLLEQAITIVPELAEVDTKNWKPAEKYYIPEESLEETFDQRKARRIEELAKNDVRGEPIKLLNKWTRTFKGNLKDIGRSVGDIVRTRVPKLARPLMQMESSINEKNREYQERIRDFVDKYRAMSKSDQRLLDLALGNPNYADYDAYREEILDRYNMQESYRKVRDVLDEIQERSREVNMRKYKDIPNYFPRRIKDINEFMKVISEDPEYNVIQLEINRLGDKATQKDKEDAIHRIFNTGNIPALSLLDPTSTKERKFPVVSSRHRYLYENSVDGLVNHIYEMNEEIAKREFFQDPKRRKLVAEYDDLYKKIEKDNAKRRQREEEGVKGLVLLPKKKREAMIGKMIVLEEQLENADEEFRSALIDIMAKEYPTLGHEATQEVIRAIRARLTQKGMSGGWSTIRNLALASVLGNPTSAITQIGDLAFSVYSYGPRNTVRSILGEKILGPEDLDLSHSMKEFQQQGTARYLDKVLEWSGLKMMDQFGKRTTMNAAIKSAQDMDIREFTKRYGDILAEDTQETFEDLKAGRNTELTRFFAFTELAKWQPISLSEMPVKYLTGGNGRIFYALKSYNIKAMNNLYRELTAGWREGGGKTKAQAARDTGRLLLFMVMMGATADELKDFLLQKDAATFSDNVWENVLKVGLMSRYTLEKGLRSDPIQTFLGDVLVPPTRFATDPFKDIISWFGDEPDLKTVQNLPWGNIPYSWISPKEESRDMKNLKEEITGAFVDGKSFSAIRKRMNKYNAWARKNDENLITFSSLSKAKRRKIKEELGGK